jgi:hypothetical protein
MGSRPGLVARRFSTLGHTRRGIVVYQKIGFRLRAAIYLTVLSLR